MQIEKLITCGEKQTSVILEFPMQSDEKAEDEFVDKLKQLYLKKVMVEAKKECMKR